MTRKNIIFFVILTILIGIVIIAWTYPRLKVIEKAGPHPEIVSAILPAGLDVTSTSIGSVFNDWNDFIQTDPRVNYQNKFSADTVWNHFFLFHKQETPQSSFPSDEELTRNRGTDSSVERYVRIPPERRKQDLYFYESTGDFYWTSEYSYNGQPAKFRCSFIIHMEAVDPYNTKVEIFEYQPTLLVGRYLGLSAHSILPAMLYDIRPVEATTKDRKVLMAVIQKSANPLP